LQPPFAVYEIEGHLASFATADLNGDGRIDAVVSGPRTLSVFFGRSDGSFAPPTVYSMRDGLSHVTLADLDHDGHLDIVGAVVMSSTIAVLRGLGDGSFGPRVDFATSPYCGDLAVADLNGDGHLDVAACGRDGYTILLGDGRGSLTRYADVATA